MNANTDIIRKKLKTKIKKEEILVGVLSKHKKGFGFVIPETDEGGDVFVAPNAINGAMNGDSVSVRLLPPGETNRTREGVIQQILKRAAT